jgi:iron uptake system EfeUOB component EfeO/EfeM
VRSETATLVELTIPFAAAVKGGDVERLYFVARVHYDPIEPIAESLPPLGNRARPLMDEVAGKVTGEEERYSHTDLVDFQRNPDGVNTVHAELRAVLADRDPTLAETLDTRFAGMQDARDEGRVRPYTSLARAHVLDEHDAAPRGPFGTDDEFATPACRGRPAGWWASTWSSEVQEPFRRRRG